MRFKLNRFNDLLILCCGIAYRHINPKIVIKKGLLIATLFHLIK